MSAGDQPPPGVQQQQVQVPILRQIQYAQLFVGEVVTAPDGTRIVPLMVPNGDVHVFPFSREAAEALGRQLIAPSVEVARAMPPNGHQPMGGH